LTFSDLDAHSRDVKEVLQTGRRVVDDLDALRALAHRERSAILKLLMAGRSRTATECAQLVDASPSACSYHLRQLERFGFVERDDESDHAERVDGRMRRWKAAAIGFSLGGTRPSEATPEQLAVFSAVRHADRTENDRLERTFTERFADLAPEWQDAAEFSTYELQVTPTEVRHLLTEIDRLLLPYRVGARSGAPESARSVHLELNAFRRLDEDDDA
jgi:DNA-binding transcriptional ArsR family regulator